MADLARGLLVAAEARTWCGTPFIWQQSLKHVGCDCKGLVRGVAAELGFPEAQSLYALKADYRNDRPIPSALLRQGLAEVLEPVPFDQLAVERWIHARPDQADYGRIPDVFTIGSVLLGKVFGKATHLGIYVGDGRVVHAQIEPNDRVKDASLKAWLKIYDLAAIFAWRPLVADTEGNGRPLPSPHAVGTD